MGSNAIPTSTIQPYGDKVPIIYNYGQLKEIEEKMNIDPRKPVYKLEPLYQEGRLIAYRKEELMPRIQRTVYRPIGTLIDKEEESENDFGWGLLAMNHQKQVEDTGFAE